ncbi:hypothetical protein ACIA5E_19025 [Nocardia asteroides]|uniref:hypothetical protein n=1 Tax=Nocardia asteroides TaxID=1824 RepID=UPI003788DB88
MVNPDPAGEAAVNAALRWLGDTSTKRVRAVLASAALPDGLRPHEGFVRERLEDPFTWTQEHRIAVAKAVLAASELPG